MIFKKGDIVECKNHIGALKKLTNGEVYIVEEVTLKNTLKLVGVDGNWRSYRFTHTKNGIVKQILEDL